MKDFESMARMVTHEELNAMPGREIKEKRTRTSKIYDLGGGHYQAVLYPEPVHERNASGEWEEIDHTLTRNAEALESASPDLNARFAPGGAVTLTKGGYTLAWSVPKAQAVPPQRQEADSKTSFPRHEKARALESAVQYPDLLPGVDFTAHIQPGRFKDALIFHTAQSVQPVEFRLRAPGLRLEQRPNGDVAAMDGDRAIFRLPAPVVTDNQGNPIPGSAHALLEEVDRESWAWTVTLDAGFAAGAAYPICLDPAVETEQTGDALSMAYVSSKHPTTNYPATGYSAHIAHNHASWGECYTLLRFESSSLPDIDSSYYVTAATLTLRCAAAANNKRVLLKEVLDDWSATEITYQQVIDSPSFVSDKPLDFQPGGNTGSYLRYHIANLVRKWYAGDNHGIMLQILQNGLVQLGAAGAVYYKPYVTIDYISLAGLEDYLAQESHACGRAGTAYVGLFNGNLAVAHQDTAMNGRQMPFSLARYYNSCYRNDNAFGVGYGWKLSSQQTLHRETIGSVLHYAYTDGDGARHHFKQTSGVWNDLSGLGLKLTISGSTATITDKGDNTMTFDLPTAEFDGNYGHAKMIRRMTNALGASVSFVHNSAGVTTSITDGAGRVTSCSADAVTAPGMASLSFTRTDGRLTQITHEDGKATQYAYDASTGLLTRMTNHDGASLEFSYTAQSPYRVTQVTCKDKNGAVCGSRRYDYGDCRTTVTELYPDSDGLTEGKALVYHFNDAGNVISVNDGLGYGCFAGYSSSMPLNHPEYVSRMQRVVNNYLRNHNFLTVNTEWTTANLNGATGSGSYASDQIYMGGRAYKLSKTSADGQVTVYQTVTLTKGRAYTFSCYYKTASAAAAQLRAEWQNSAGVMETAVSAAAASVDRWDRLSVSFTLPADAASSAVTVRMMAAGGMGAVWVDAAQVEDGPVLNRYNLALNGAFAFNSSGLPESWTAGDENTADDDRLISGGSIIDGRPSELTGGVLRLKGEPGKVKQFSQSFSCMGAAGDTYIAGGWSASYTRPRDDSAPCLYEMEIRARNTSGSYVTVGKVRWSEEWSGWQFAAIPIVMPEAYQAVQINIIYRNNLNEAQFSNLFLHKEEFGKTFAYDSNGNVTSVRNMASLQSYGAYDSFNNLLAYRQPGRPSTAQYTQAWGDTDAERKKHLLRTAQSPTGVIRAYTYDAKGNVLTGTTRNAAGTLTIASSAAYTADGNYVSSQTDARGKTVTIVTDANNGAVASVTDPNGQSVAYSYDGLNRRTASTASADGKTYRNTYTYTGDLLTRISHNTTADDACDVNYHFAYDAQNRPTTVKVSHQTLSETVYNTTAGDPLYGTVTGVNFGNGGRERNTYDDYKRLTGVRFDGDTEDRYRYAYGANGQVAKVTDNLLGRTAVSEYDVESRPMRIIHMEGDDHLYTGQVWYDEYSNLQTFKEQVGTSRTAYQTDFTYDTENKPTLMTFGDTSNKVAYAYDAIGRMSGRTVTVGGTAYATAYGYLAGCNGSGSTTPLIASMSQNSETCAYTYDDVGNILTATRNGVTASYVYDNLGQLIRVNDPDDTTSGSAGTTWFYDYDRGGNILMKKRYAYATGGVGDVLQTISYTYGDSNWKDKLTAYDGTAITYDAIGNPLSDGTWTYTWEKGRQLKQMTNGTTTAAFAYNANGLRVRKTVNGVVTNYTLHGKNIVHMTHGSNDLHFFYDAQNRPAIVAYNGTKYAYIYNLQGDVLGLIDSNGTEVVKYTYDAWGKVLSTTGSLAPTLGIVQPFRYRGYVYDVETGLYYLRSRYYNPGWQRFVNADIVYHGNIYAYCGNVPTILIDPDGASSHLYSEDAWKEEKFGKHNKDEKLTAEILIGMLERMVDEGWGYHDRTMRYKTVDCLAMIRHCAKAWYKYKAYSYYGINTTTSEQYKSMMKKGMAYGEIDDITDLKPGTILYDKDKKHVGVYIGYYSKETPYAVIQSSSYSSPLTGKSGVQVWNYYDTQLNAYYCEYDFIDLNLTYEQTKERSMEGNRE